MIKDRPYFTINVAYAALLRMKVQLTIHKNVFHQTALYRAGNGRSKNHFHHS